MKKSLRVMMTLVFTVVLFAALAITASAKNWYATESAGGVDRLYITAADTEPGDGKTWSDTVPAQYDGSSVYAWIQIPSPLANPVKIVISGDVVCPVDDSLDYGIYKYYDVNDDGYNEDEDVIITGNGTGKLTINLTGDTHTGSAAIYNNSLSNLTISDMADMTLTAAKSDSDKLYSCGIYSYSKLTITNSTIGDITAGHAYYCYGIYSSVNTEITNSTIGDISTGDSEYNNYAIYTNEDFTITDSTIGDISTGDAKYENAGIYCDGEFTITDSTIGDISTGDAKYENAGIYCDGEFKITNSTIGDISTGDSEYNNYAIYTNEDFTITNSTIGNISAGYTNYVNFGIYCDGEFKITNSTIGDISTKDTDDENYGIYCDSDFEIKDSTIGDISTGDAKDENAGIYCDGKFTITDSTIGNISAGDVPESGYSYGIYVDYDAKSSAQAASADGAATYGYVGDDENGNVGFTITNSAIGDITAGNAYYSMGICSSYLTITDSTFVAAGSSGTETSYGIWTFFLTIGESNPNAKYALDVTATGHCAISLGFSFTDAEGTIKLAGASKETAETCSDADDFVEKLETAKYARIYVARIATPTITETDIGQGRKRITITCATPDARIYYSLNGGGIASPEAGTLYTGPFELSDDAVITARAFREGYVPSPTATLEVEFEKQDGGADPLQYLLLIISRPKYKVTVEGGVTASVKEGLSLSALYAGELVTLTVAPGEDGGYTAPTVTTSGGGKVYLTDLGGGVYTFKMPSRDVIVKP